ncbi:Putative inorganic phosphate cotransporter-like Protein [Tribolium castaneum]|uniref:Inorganic phosphate cotransporter-like Protein n=1 Tax=Tribolium castaneum TaxID=7070 RepID=D6WY10_TRICA|nr:Putative inorganic phosphate cotransporter-like Protein [Tribolium castaneum]
MSGLQQNSSGATSRSSDLEAKCCVALQRWVFCLLAFLAVFISATMYSLPSLVEETKTIRVKNINSSDYCASKINYTRTVVVINDTTLYAIHWGYLVSSLPAAVVSDQFGGKYVVTLSLLFSSFWCLINPAMAALSKRRPGWMAGTRFFRGFFKGFAFPAIMSLLARWAPDTERTTMTALVYGSYLLAYLLTREIRKMITNEGCYLVFGSLGVIYSLLWHLFLYPSPDEHPSIMGSELKYLDENTEDKPIEGRKKIPWLQMLTSRPVLALWFFEIGQSWTWVSFIHAYDVYLPQVLKLTDSDNNVLMTPLYLSFGLAVIFGFISDWFIKGKHLSVTTMRKIAASLGNTGAACSYMFAIFRRCSTNAVMIHFALGMCFEAFISSSSRVNHLDLASNFVGTLLGISQTLAQILLYVGLSQLPVLLKPESSLTQWAALFWFTLGLNVVSTTIYLVFGSGVRQEWNFVQ